MTDLSKMSLEELASDYYCGQHEGDPSVLIELRRRQRMLDAAEGMANELRVTLLKIYAGSRVKIAEVGEKLDAYQAAKGD